MPIIIHGEQLKTVPATCQEFFKDHPQLEAEAKSLHSQPIKKVGAKNLFYVCQRELAVLSPHDEHGFHILGSDDATTCHHVIIRHTGSGVTGLGHFDGCATEVGIRAMIHKVQQMSTDAPSAGRLEAHLFGGFLDDKNSSEELSQEILSTFQGLDEEIHLMTACITGANNRVVQGIPFPVFYGIAIDVRSGVFYNASFDDKGPDLSIRSAANFQGIKNMPNVYDNATGQLVIGPFKWKPWTQVSKFLALPDPLIRQYLSTSPAQEPAHFVSSTRQALLLIRDNPRPEKTLFQSGKARRYNKDQSTGTWNYNHSIKMSTQLSEKPSPQEHKPI